MKARQYGDRVGRKEASEGFFTIDRITLGGKGIETLSPCLLLLTGSRGLPFDPVLKICLDMCVGFGGERCRFKWSHHIGRPVQSVRSLTLT